MVCHRNEPAMEDFMLLSSLSCYDALNQAVLIDCSQN